MRLCEPKKNYAYWCESVSDGCHPVMDEYHEATKCHDVNVMEYWCIVNNINTN